MTIWFFSTSLCLTLAAVACFFMCLLALLFANARKGWAPRWRLDSGPGAWISGLSLTAVSLSLCFMAVEVLLPFTGHSRALKTLNEKRFKIDDPLTWYKWAPGAEGRIVSPEFNTSVRINTRGLRGPEPEASIPPEGSCILLLGDSFTFGYGVEESESCAGLLRKRLEGRFGVLNSGVNGYGALNELMYYFAEGRNFHPKAVVLFHYCGDLMDNIYLPRQMLAKDGVNLDAAALIMLQTGYSFVKGGAAPGRAPSNLGAFLTDGLTRLFAPSCSSPQDLFMRPNDLTLFVKNPPERLFNHWRGNLQWLLQLNDLCQQDGAPLVIASIPAWLQVHDEDWEAFAAHMGGDESALDRFQPQRLLRALAREHGLRLVDLLPALRAEGRDARLYFRHDDHLNAEGHALAASVVLSHLEILLNGEAACVP